jgi:hypothetical protein
MSNEIKEYDAILEVNYNLNDLNEGIDDRNYASNPVSGADKPIKGNYSNYIDPKFYSSWSFGRQLRSILNGMGSGYSSEVTDFGQEIVVRVTHSDTVTGRSSSKTFLIIFTDKKGNAMVKNHSNKWRSVSGIDQAASYIRSICSNLQANTQQKL